ncbi:LPXTG cell wall anchor domain-containing protein [Streptococcus downii]|uniref:LPXTG cell wall anchor domain-containing protein n=2 Tax=Streptococcus TaxID=1301 RepID=A0AAW5WCQ1_STROR|nr:MULTISPECIES: LPXTG cell wall anchor domain-containing protein [Streptococcus]MCY7059291.1 LPXTG cell wall anchor domain-containing protein [Streptococcus oralis]
MIKYIKCLQKLPTQKLNLRNNYQNTGEKESGLLALIGASTGLLALAGKRKYR